LTSQGAAAVPDRIPCLKVKLMLPNWTGSAARGGPSPDMMSGAQGLKKVSVVYFCFCSVVTKYSLLVDEL